MEISEVEAFQKRAQISRRELDVESLKLRPISAPSHVDISVPGFVGRDYRRGGLCIVSVNPAGGKDDYKSTTGDTLIYDAAAEFAHASPDMSATFFRQLGSAFVEAMPSWGAQWRHVSAILNAARLPLSEIAYVYLVPFRTRKDEGSKLPSNVLQLATRRGFYDVLDSLKPRLLIAVDGPSNKAASGWVKKREGEAEVLYYTRKRDDHAGRAKALEVLKSRSE